MPGLPLEIKALIIAEVWKADPRRIHSLSALSLVWKDAASFIREWRFNDVSSSDEHFILLSGLLNDEWDPLPLIRKLKLYITRPLDHPINGPRLFATVAQAVNVENLTFVGLSARCSVGVLSESLIGYRRLTTLTFSSLCVHIIPWIKLLHAIPHLVSLTLAEIRIIDCMSIALEVWPHQDRDSYSLGPPYFTVEECAPFDWETHVFQTPHILPNLTHLSFNFLKAPELMLLDLIASSKTPFPNIQRLQLSDRAYSYRTPRITALMRRFKSSLTSFELMEHTSCRDARPGFDQSRFVLPAGVRSYRFLVEDSAAMYPDTLYHNVLSGNLDVVTMRMNLRIPLEHYHHPISHQTALNVARLDELMSSLNIPRFNIEISGRRITQSAESAKAVAAIIFPLCTATILKGSEGGCVSWNHLRF